LEAKAGVSPPPASSGGGGAVEEELHPSLKAYDTHIEETVKPFVNACNDLPGLKNIGSLILETWMTIRSIIRLGTKCKKPKDVATALKPLLTAVQTPVQSISKMRLDRDYDWHQKAIMEMLVSISWVVCVPPPNPSMFVKETIGSTDFWSNKIRKMYKGKDEKQILFCDALKKLIQDLAKYCQEFHLSGLFWNNARGVDMESVDVNEFLAGAEVKEAKKEAPKPAAAPAAAAAGGGAAALFGELAVKRTNDGTSAATGLRKVTKDQQTWRKEFKGGEPTTTPTTTAKPTTTTAAVAVPAKKKKGPPKCEYQNQGSKWNIENQTKDDNTGLGDSGMLEITVTDAKQQVYIYKCENITINVTGKLKSIILDSCSKTNILFDSAISACEIVNCKRVQVQTRGLCPSVSIDKTDGCLVYLSKESLSSTSFVTSKSTEMNVNWEGEDGETKEAPIPEQFVHKLVNGSITSDVSDLYH